MKSQIIDGKKLAEDIKNNVKQEINRLGFTPGLAVFLVGDDEASKLYVSLKEKASKEVGIDFHKYLCSDETCETDVLEAIDFLNQDDHVNAILVQLPLPDGFHEQQVIDKLNPEKDVDGFHPQTMENFLEDKDDFLPGLSEGIARLVESTGETLNGQHAVIVSNSDIFARPLQKLFKNKDMTAEHVSPKSDNIAEKTSGADVLVTAVGRPEFIGADMLKENAIVIDVGTTKEGKSVTGDVDFEAVKDKVGHITPVPGGVGPVTVAMLLENTVELAKRQNNK